MGARHGARAGSRPVNATVCRDVAFDTVIMVKQTPRRMLAAVQEVCGGRVLIPDETAREAGKVYVRVAAGQARRETQWKAMEQCRCIRLPTSPVRTSFVACASTKPSRSRTSSPLPDPACRPELGERPST